MASRQTQRQFEQAHMKAVDTFSNHARIRREASGAQWRCRECGKVDPDSAVIIKHLMKDHKFPREDAELSTVHVPAGRSRQFEVSMRVGSGNMELTPGILAHAIQLAMEEAGLPVSEMACIEVTHA